MSTKAPEQEHGPETVCYSNGYDGYRPFLQCLCGWSIREENWEFIGLEFDQHLSSTKAPISKAARVCEDCGDEIPKTENRIRCNCCGKLICHWCNNHAHNLSIQERTKAPQEK